MVSYTLFILCQYLQKDNDNDKEQEDDLEAQQVDVQTEDVDANQELGKDWKRFEACSLGEKWKESGFGG